MTLLILGLVLFIGIHLLPTRVALRTTLVARFGEKGFQGLFSLFALAGFVTIIMGMRAAPFEPVWNPPAWGRSVTLPLMMLSLYALTASKLPSNIKRLTPHPMLWGVILWSAAHLLANGDLASLLLFGALALFAVIDIASANKRGASRLTSPVPLVREAVCVAVAGVSYLALVLLHPYISGVPIV
jgi:uncharacterized membrane protein